MSEISGQTGSSLAVVEKKPERPGGCAGIFFQLFDWNRRLGKKKLFSKKLIPPARVRKPSKKFPGDEKLPKLRLIADENSGGFPHGKKNNGGGTEQNELLTPGLVARLMGLESMPAARQNKEKNGSLSGAMGNKEDKFIDGNARFGRAELDVEKGDTKQELRPQKVQKTGLSEKRPVTRFGAEALQLKNVLSRSRKYHHQKLVPPVKSPRNVSGRNASRLFGAATRILEPGLQRSKSKCSLTYSNEYHPPPEADVLMEEAKDLKPLENSFHFQSSAKTLNEQSSSCKNCGHLLNVADIRPNIEEQPPISLPASQIIHPSAQLSERGNPRPPIFCPQMEMGRNKEGPQLRAAFGMEARQVCSHYVPDKKFLDRECQRQWQPTSQHFKLQKDSSSVYSRQKVHGQNQISQGRERLPSRSKISRLQSCRLSSTSNAINETKDFAVMNQNFSDTTRLRMPVGVNSYWLDTDCKTVDRRHDSLSPMRKRRTPNNSRQNEGPCFLRSSTKPTNNRSKAISGKDRCCSSHYTQGLAHLQESMCGNSGKNDTDVISFTFKSPMKHKTGVRENVEVRRNQDGQTGGVAYNRTPSNEFEGKSSLKTLPLNGDSLGAFLEQKLKELTCQEEDGSTFGGTTPKKTIAMILQELISALTTERPSHQDDLSHGENKKESYFCVDNQQSKRNASTIFQAKQKSNNNSAGNLPNSEHLSPGSVLEASFSNDSCCSSSIDEGSRCNMSIDSTECCEEPKLLESDADLSDSTSSLGTGKFYRDSVINLLDNISEVFGTLNLGDVSLKGCKLTHAKEVILNAELVFGNAALPDGVVNGGFSISNFVLHQLEMLASVLWRNFSAFVALDTKEKNQLKGFVFDCFIEYLESKFGRYSNSGFNAWTRLPLRMKTEMLICEIVEGVGSWAALAGLFPDELIEHEMSHSLGKWTDFELEAFETGIEMEQQILQTLISEMLLDFTYCNPK